MSSQITEAFVSQFKSNIFHLSQQKGSKLRPFVRSEMQNGKRAFYDRLGITEAVEKTSRHMDTPYIENQHSRRAVSLIDALWADLIDDEDKIRMLIDPASAYSQQAMWAMGRKMDRILIAAMRGNAYSGEQGTTPVALPASQKVLAAADSALGTPTGLNLDTLRRIKYVFDSNDVDESIPRYLAVTAKQIQDLLNEDEVASADYNSIKALVQGQIDTFMGFKFIRTQLLPTETATYNATTGAVDSGGGSLADARRCLAWAGDGVVLAIGRDMEAKIEKLPTKNYATQVFARMTVGATRLEESKVVEVVCKEA